MTALEDPVLSGIANQTFRLVRKGFDPEQVRAYLGRLDAAVRRLVPPDPGAWSPPPGAPPQGTPAPQGATAPGGAADAEAQAEARLAHLQAQQDALRAWFGEDGRADPDAVPDEVTEAAARANALIREAEVQVAEMKSEAQSAPAPADAPADADGNAGRWEDLGEHVARILAHADQEAVAITTAAQANAGRLGEAAEADRVAARDRLAESELRARALMSDAEAEASTKRDQIEPQVRDHVAAVLASARAELDATNEALRDARRRLSEIHSLVGRSVDQAGPEGAFDEPEAFFSGRAAPSADGGRAPARTDPGPKEVATTGGAGRAEPTDVGPDAGLWAPMPADRSASGVDATAGDQGGLGDLPAPPGATAHTDADGARPMTVDGPPPKAPGTEAAPATEPEADSSGWMARLRPGSGGGD